MLGNDYDVLFNPENPHAPKTKLNFDEVRERMKLGRIY